MQGEQGPIGLTGLEGPQGIAGANGIDGAQGPQGPAGPQGLAGAQGPQGAAGQNGLSAYEIAVQNGYTGTESQWLSTAIVGPQGPQGIAGPQGPAGTNGIDGATGPQGIQGIQGSTGAAGPQGIQGPQGIAGTNGTNGVDGAQGPAGQNGINGQDGLSAYQIWLNAGNTGTEAQFLTSLEGATGQQGIQGLTGPNGPQGPAGANGINGTDGTNGTNGLSAYQVWLNLGNIGTEADFIASLTGPQGIQGAQGTNGDDGQDGINTLVNTTVEQAGANCANGGTKIEVGLDIDGNGVLDSNEINGSLTKYVCNGINGTTVANGTPPSLPILFPSDYVNNTNYNYGDMIYDAQNGKVKVAVPSSNGSQNFFTNNDTICSGTTEELNVTYSITFQTINTLIFSASTYADILAGACNNCSSWQYFNIRLYEVPLSGGIYDDGILINSTSVLSPSKKYRIEIYTPYFSINPGTCGFFILGSLPTINTSLFTNFYYWKTNSSNIKSSVTEFPKFTNSGGLKLSSPPVLGWINMN